ncbi:aminopeptidase [Paractinoplanes abujensis]|uniref:Aminotransferase n=1 Tax=Paractinoplanes abujensis TaxID=882441 RepID=A0A7W7CJY0_9ACTN|nr:pyridoxal phosphate-dependent aminotransferase [Actinoplanes abujensis]MBB4689956.1 aspartate aminotransferase [Actinoplanes abujensis]GID24637.1 aminopeptidase [Actinoplanes abujensis]
MLTELASRPMSPNLALNQQVAERRANGEDILHLGFGESRLPAFEPLVDSLIAGARRNAYGPVQGDAAVRAAVAGYFTRRRLPTEPGQVMVAPGSKPLLMALNLVLPGDVVLARPAWNSYAPQAFLAGRHTIAVPIPAEAGGVPDPAALVRAIAAARRAGRDPRTVVLTLPDNPTGTLAPPALIRRICAIAEQEDLTVVSDEIYRDVLHDPATPFLSPAEVIPHRTVVTSGLSKSLALGGWRIGVARFPGDDTGRVLRDNVLSVASEVWSTLAAPMQEVATYAFAEPAVLRDHLAAGARLHGAVARAVHGILTAAGAACRPPTGGFYVYPDFEPLRPVLAAKGVTDSPSLARHLLDTSGLAVLAGHLLGDDPGALRFKAATSMLYGDTAAQQREALDAADPLTLPHVAAGLRRIDDGVRALVA